MKNGICGVLQFFVGVVAIIANDAEAQTQCYWAEVENRIGAVLPDGTAKCRMEISDENTLALMGVSLGLEHSVEADAYGHPISVWHFQGLRSALVPQGRDKLVWSSLAGVSFYFPWPLRSKTRTADGSGRAHICGLSDGTFEVDTIEGRRWFYRAGVLTKISDPLVGDYDVQTLGAFVRSIKRSQLGSDSTPIIEVSYDDAARPTILRIRGARTNTFGWNSTGWLTLWTDENKRETHFAYDKGLLVSVSRDGRAVQQFEWQPNSGYGRGDSFWLKPVHLSSDGENTYQYSVTPRGYRICRISRIDHSKTITYINPVTKRLEQGYRDTKRVVNFVGHGPASGLVESVYTSTHELLEQYQYDEVGQLQSVTRHVNPDRD